VHKIFAHLKVDVIFAPASPTQLAPAELLQGGNAAKVSGRSSVM